MTEVPHESLFRLAERYIGDRANIEVILAELLGKPEIFTVLAKEFNVAVVAVNNFLQAETVNEAEQRMLRNTMFLRDALGGKKLPTLIALEEDRTFGTLRTGVKTLKFADELMKRGETGGPEPKWEFHQTVSGEQLAASLLLEIYGKFAEKKFPQQFSSLENGGFTAVLTLKEMVAFYHEAMPRIFDAVKGWYSEDEGFSKELVQYVQKIMAERREPSERAKFQGVIRAIGPSDLTSLKSILDTWIRDKHTGAVITEEIEEDVRYMSESAQGHGERHYLVAQDTDGSVVGVIGYRRPSEAVQPFTTTTNPTEMVNMFVAGKHRAGRGVGRALFQALEDRIRAEGYSEMVWDSGPRHLKTAWRFYNSLPGVEQAGVAQRRYGDSDAMVWRKALV